MVRPERVELPTYWFVASRSIQLSYGRTRVASSETIDRISGFLGPCNFYPNGEGMSLHSRDQGPLAKDPRVVGDPIGVSGCRRGLRGRLRGNQR